MWEKRGGERHECAPRRGRESMHWILVLKAFKGRELKGGPRGGFQSSFLSFAGEPSLGGDLL